MPLLDHFRPPLRDRRHWESFHATWAVSIMRALNRDLLPAGYFAEAQAHIGTRIEVDVGTFEEGNGAAGAVGTQGTEAAGGVATAALPARVWAPPAPDLEMPAVFPDSVEVRVFNAEGGPTLVAAVELISPRNKDRPAARRAFAAKCAAYFQQEVGLVTVDIVTDRQANLHNELVRVLEADEGFLLAPDPLYAVAYRPGRRKAGEDVQEKIQVWTAPLAVGGPLPVLPLALDKGIVVRLDLELTYSEARQEMRLA
jgi:hypothetical protein